MGKSPNWEVTTQGTRLALLHRREGVQVIVSPSERNSWKRVKKTVVGQRSTQWRAIETGDKNMKINCLDLHIS